MTATLTAPAPAPPSQQPGQRPQRRTPSVGLVVAVIALAWLLVVIVAVGGLLAVGGFAVTSAARKESSCSVAGTGRRVAGVKLDAEQLANAQLIVTTAAAGGYSQQAARIAVATAMTESSLRNVAHGDTAGPDSAGLFQQRVSYGPTRTDPTAAAAMFLARLVKVRGWESMTLTAAAAAVQRPRADLAGAYAADEVPASELVSRFWPQTSSATTQTPTQTPSSSSGSTSTAAVSTTSNAPVTSPQAAAAPAATGSSPTTSPSSSPAQAAQALAVLAGTSCFGQDGEGRSDGGGTVQLPQGWRAVGGTEVTAAITFALKQVGKPYVWGGVGPAGFDCSGLMMKAWAAAGVAIPRTTVGQRTSGIAVSGVGDLQPGDLIFIAGSEGTADAPRHVGMFLGDVAGVPSIVQAPKTGDVVQVDPLSRWDGLIVAIRRTVTT